MYRNITVSRRTEERLFFFSISRHEIEILHLHTRHDLSTLYNRALSTSSEHLSCAVQIPKTNHEIKRPCTITICVLLTSGTHKNSVKRLDKIKPNASPQVAFYEAAIYEEDLYMQLTSPAIPPYHNWSTYPIPGRSIVPPLSVINFRAIAQKQLKNLCFSFVVDTYQEN